MNQTEKLLITNCESDIESGTSIESVWYDLCYRFYANHDLIGKAAIQWFQNHSPGSADNISSSSYSSNSPLSPQESLTPEQEVLYIQCGIYQCSEDQWYQLEKIRNQARSMAHSNGTKNRLYEVLYQGQVHQVNQANISLKVIKQITLKFSSTVKLDIGLRSFYELVLEWLRQQLLYPTCTIVSIHASEFTERPAEITHQLLLFLCSIGRFQVPNCFIPVSTSGITTEYRLMEGITPSDVKLQWIMKEDLSNHFLRILIDSLLSQQSPSQRTGSGNQTARRVPTTNISKTDELFPLIQSEKYRERVDEIDDEMLDSWRLCFCCY